LSSPERWLDCNTPANVTCQDRSVDEPNLKGHFDLLERARQEWPDTKQHLSTRISETTVQDFENTIDDLLRLELPVRYCEDRHQFICKLLQIRLLKLKDLLR